LARLVGALRPWLPQPVIVGGWDHRLHRFHPLATRERFAVVTDVIREAARLPQDRTLRPEVVQAACVSGLDEIFSEAKF
jgi:hypothetical protein